MRSPEGWPPAPRRRTRLLLPWLLAAAVAVALAVVLALQLRPSSVDAPPLASTAPSEDCALGDCLAAAPPGPAAPPAGPAPEITAQAAAVVEDSCGALVYGKSADLQLPPASLTKLATALVAVERTPDLSRKVDVRVNSGLLAASTNSTIMGFRPGVRLSMRDLLAGLLLVSGNDAAIAIAE
ncbi:MAG: hypothetical protein Q8S13_13325, partial [Dehalococcoidia bacterium]|nr:hypothetical protein [Dehalococcoidia bacterium]